MTRKKLLFNVPALSLLLALMLVLAYQAGGSARVAPNRPAVIATVNLAEVLDGLAQRGEAEAKLQSMASEVVAERERRETRLNDLLKQLEDMRTAQGENAEDLESIQKLEEQIVLERLNYQAWTRFKMDQLDVERALLLEELYRAIKSAARELAQASGYDFVVHNDAGAEITVNPESRATRESQVQQAIISRTLLYAAPIADITNDLIERMNNEFRMRGMDG